MSEKKKWQPILTPEQKERVFNIITEVSKFCLAANVNTGTWKVGKMNGNRCLRIRFKAPKSVSFELLEKCIDCYGHETLMMLDSQNEKHHTIFFSI